MIERTFDYRQIKRHVWWQPVISREVIYLVDDGFGLWALHEHLDGLMIHVEMAVHCRGKSAVEKGRQALKWVFDNTDVKTIYARIPAENRPACHNAVYAGMIFTHEKDDERFYEIAK